MWIGEMVITTGSCPVISGSNPESAPVSIKRDKGLVI